MISHLAIALALPFAAAHPVSAQTAPPAPTAARSDPRVSERALALAKVLNSDFIVIGDEEDDTKALALMDQLIGGSVEFAELEKDYPGIVREIGRAMMPIINRSARERLPQLWERQAALYARHFNAAELDTLIAFYSSPTGVKLINSTMQNLKLENSIAEATGSPELNISATSVIADIGATMPQTMKTMNAEDERVFLALVESRLLPRLHAMAVQTQEIALAWYDESAPWEEAETDKVIMAIMETRIGASE